jgi:hypothetical protein
VPVSSRFLGPGEEVLVDLHPHWRRLAAPVVVSVVAVAAAAALTDRYPHAPSAVSVVLLALALVPLGWLAVRLAQWWAESLVVTTERLVLRRGLVRRDLVQLRLSRIAEVHCSQTLGERLLGTGRLVVELAGEDGAVTVDDVRRPRVLQRVLAARLEEAAEPVPSPAPGWVPAPSAAPAGPVWTGDITPPQGVPAVPRPQPGSVPEQLVALDDLRRRGIVTEEEFAAKKAELLSRL